MKQRVQVHEVRVGGDDIRVIRPASTPARLVLHDDHYSLSMYADGEGGAQLVALWSLAARSARSLVHLPIRANPAPEGVVGDGVPVALDLVLLHHSLQFPASSWKRVRSRLGRGRPHTAATPDDDLPAMADIDFEWRRHRESRDILGLDIAAHTLFVRGSAPAFREYGAALRAMLDEAPSYLHEYPNAGHYCVEFGRSPWCLAEPRRHVPGQLHIQYCDPWSVLTDPWAV